MIHAEKRSFLYWIPKDEKLKKLWLSIIYPGQTLKQYCRVCSEHFEGGKKTYPDWGISYYLTIINYLFAIIS